MSPSVTHIIAIDSPSTQAHMADTWADFYMAHFGTLVVTPHWVDDSVKIKKRLPEAPYYLITAETGSKTNEAQNTIEMMSTVPSIQVSPDMFKNCVFYLNGYDAILQGTSTKNEGDSVEMEGSGKNSTILQKLRQAGGRLSLTYDPDHVTHVLCHIQNDIYKKVRIQRKMFCVPCFCRPNVLF